MKKLIKLGVHLLHYGGIYLFLALFYATIFWVLPLMSGSYRDVALLHGLMLSLAWMGYGISRAMRPRP